LLFLLKFFIVNLIFLLFVSDLTAQILILYTDNDSYGRVGKEKIFTLAEGQPAFANFFDLKVPSHFFIITPKGERQKLTLLRKKLYDPWFNTPRIAYEIKIQPKEAGDYLLCIEGDDTLTLNGTLKRSYAKTLFHVQKETSWDRFCGFPLEIKPLTRPYGLKKGVLFRGQVLYESKPLKEIEIIVERLRFKLNPSELPKDSNEEINVPLFLKKLKTDNQGFFYTNFEEEGWWVITAKFPRGVKSYGNKMYPYELQTHLWIFVFP